MATAHFQSTGTSFEQGILCQPEPLETHSFMPLCFYFVPSFNESFLQEKLWAMPATFIGAGSPVLWCSVSPSGTAEQPDEMSSRWKLGQHVKSDGDSQPVKVVLPSYPNSGWFSHCAMLWAAKPTISFITKAAFLLGRDLENCSRTGYICPGKVTHLHQSLLFLKCCWECPWHPAWRKRHEGAQEGNGQPLTVHRDESNWTHSKAKTFAVQRS